MLWAQETGVYTWKIAFGSTFKKKKEEQLSK